MRFPQPLVKPGRTEKGIFFFSLLVFFQEHHTQNASGLRRILLRRAAVTVSSGGRKKNTEEIYRIVCDLTICFISLRGRREQTRPRD